MSEGKANSAALMADLPRVQPDDRLDFRCGKDLDCFTSCCRDVSIVLTPYDVLRMKKALGMDSSGFLAQHTLIGHNEKKLPIVLLRMNAEDKRCPLATPEGCGIYAHRPWACRMYPLGVARPDNPRPDEPGFYFLIKEDLCHGHGKGNGFTVREWAQGQEIEPYEMMAESFQRLLTHKFWQTAEPLSPEKADMILLAGYDLDRFRRFVFETSFLSRFEVDETRVAAMRTDALELLDFGVSWLRFCLFGERTMKLRATPLAGCAKDLPDPVIPSEARNLAPKTKPERDSSLRSE